MAFKKNMSAKITGRILKGIYLRSRWQFSHRIKNKRDHFRIFHFASFVWIVAAGKSDSFSQFSPFFRALAFRPFRFSPAFCAFFSQGESDGNPKRVAKKWSKYVGLFRLSTHTLSPTTERCGHFIVFLVEIIFLLSLNTPKSVGIVLYSDKALQWANCIAPVPDRLVEGLFTKMPLFLAEWNHWAGLSFAHLREEGSEAWGKCVEKITVS